MRIYNTLARKKEEFVSINEGRVLMYSCGPTVYNYFHIGNARPFIIFDTLRRYLEYKGYEVTFVQNFTDIDDKMIAKANSEGVTVQELAKRYIAEYEKDADALGIKPATYAPKATEHIEEIIALINTLIDKGHAYVTEDGVYFDTRSFNAYGELSGQDLESLTAGARVEPGEGKRSPMDFALWKAKKPGEPSWQAPFGEGRPGWHIECSAMSMKLLGPTIDIHSGGQDLIFPHHENEKAQSEAATGVPFVKYWMHNGYINIDNQKMSKSLGNFFTVREIGEEFDLMAVRLFMLSAHYRNPVNFSRELITQAVAGLMRIKNCRENLVFMAGNAKPSAGGFEETAANRTRQFCEAMDDDLNTADALAAIYEYVRDANAYFTAGKDASEAAFALITLDGLLGVLGINAASSDEIPGEVRVLAEKRAEARKQKDFKESDRLRDEIKALGYILEDTPGGVKIKLA